MLFTSGEFLYAFLPIFLLAYGLTPARWKSWTITLASYVFYGWWRPDFVALMWVSTVVDFACGRGIVRDFARGASGRRWVWLSCSANLGLLGYFKYANFGIDTLNTVLAEFGRGPLPWAEVLLPVGISFYTFQTLSYTVDVYRRQAEPARNIMEFASYVALFPQLVAGPIVRYRSIAGQLRERRHSLQAFSIGALVFQAGLVKKVLLADTFAIAADRAFGAQALGFESLSALEAWVGALAYTFQIYFDFSGYSDMAIGLGLLMGFHFPINFDRPYASRSITEFWRRWHISLSAFLRDYLYVPLGGNRKGGLRTYANLMVTMLLGGLWHGAAWHFVAWGLYQGVWLVIERAFGKRALWAAMPAPLQIVCTFTIVVFGWVLFRAESLEAALEYCGWMFGQGARGVGPVLAEFDRTQWAAFAIAPWILFACRTTQDHARQPKAWWAIAMVLLFVLALVHLQHVSHVPFLYFQF